MRLAALAVQQRAAASAAAKMAADAKEERASAESAPRVRAAPPPRLLGRRRDGRLARRWTPRETRSRACEKRVGRLRRGAGGVGGTREACGARSSTLGSGPSLSPRFIVEEAIGDHARYLPRQSSAQHGLNRRPSGRPKRRGRVWNSWSDVYGETRRAFGTRIGA